MTHKHEKQQPGVAFLQHKVKIFLSSTFLPPQCHKNKIFVFIDQQCFTPDDIRHNVTIIDLIESFSWFVAAIAALFVPLSKDPANFCSHGEEVII